MIKQVYNSTEPTKITNTVKDCVKIPLSRILNGDIKRITTSNDVGKFTIVVEYV